MKYCQLLGSENGKEKEGGNGAAYERDGGFVALLVVDSVIPAICEL